MMLQQVHTFAQSWFKNYFQRSQKSVGTTLMLCSSVHAQSRGRKTLFTLPNLSATLSYSVFFIVALLHCTARCTAGELLRRTELKSP